MSMAQRRSASARAVLAGGLAEEAERIERVGAVRVRLVVPVRLAGTGRRRTLAARWVVRRGDVLVLTDRAGLGELLDLRAGQVGVHELLPDVARQPAAEDNLPGRVHDRLVLVR